MKLESWHSTEDKRRWKIVRTDDYTDVAGDIITADEATGECCIQVGGETKTLASGLAGSGSSVGEDERGKITPNQNGNCLGDGCRAAKDAENPF